VTTKTTTTIILILVGVVLVWMALHFVWPILKLVLLVVGALTLGRLIYRFFSNASDPSV
jgi:hypothetical protein